MSDTVPALKDFHPDAQLVVLQILAEVEKRRRKKLALENSKNA